MRVLSMADGCGTGHHVLNMLDVVHEYISVETSPIKRAICDFNAVVERWVNDINELLEYLKKNTKKARKIGLILCGFTCKSLSSQGKRELWDGESKIFFKCLEVVNFIKSLNPHVKIFFENVASMPNKCRDLISELLGIEHFKFDAGLVGPQARERYYWFNWDKKEPVKKELYAKDFLDDDGLEIISFSKSNREGGMVQGRFRKDGKAGTLVTGKGCKGQSTMNKVFTKKMQVRDLTASECIRLQGLDFMDFSKFSDAQIFECVGEGWDYRAVTEIFKWGFL